MVLEGELFVSIERVLRRCTYEFNIALAINQHVLWFQIAIRDAMFV